MHRWGLKELDFNFDIDIDFEELNENLKNIKIDLSGFDRGMASLKVELSELKVELKVLESFVNSLKDELVDDGYIDERDDDFDLVLTKTKIIVNNERLSEKAHQKYLELYKEHFGRELDDDLKISN